LITQREGKTHRAACAIEDFIDDSKQALSTISWMAAQREGRKTRTQTGLRMLLSPCFVNEGKPTGFYNLGNPDGKLVFDMTICVLYCTENMTTLNNI
jgi:hypothetical protein